MKVTALITTLNEEDNLGACLEALTQNNHVFDEIIIIDSDSTDETVQIAARYDVPVISYQWDGTYPKKRGWVLKKIREGALKIKNDYIFFIDADEWVTKEFTTAISDIDERGAASGYFIRGQYAWRAANGKSIVLKYGLKNNKLALLDPQKIDFPIVDDLGAPAMGEIEGHYQPVLRDGYQDERIAQINAPIIHNAYQSADDWAARHDKYARWEAYMIKNNAYPLEPSRMRGILKALYRKMPARWAIAFLHSYIIKLGFLDGAAGYHFAVSRARYYKKVAHYLRA